MMKIKINTPDGEVERTPSLEPLGNFVNIVIRYKNREYFVGDGSEYMRGMPEKFDLSPTNVLAIDYKCGDMTIKAKNKIDALNKYLVEKRRIRSWEKFDIDVFPDSEEEENRVREIKAEMNIDFEVEVAE